MQGAFFARSTAISFLCNSWQAETFSASHLKQHAKALKTMLVYRICKRSLFFISKTSRRASHHIRCPHVCIAVPKVSCSTATSSSACFRTASSSPGDFVDLMHFRRSRALGLLDLSVTSRFGESKKYWSLSASGVTTCAVFLPSRTYDHLASCLIISPMTIPSLYIYIYTYTSSMISKVNLLFARVTSVCKRRPWFAQWLNWTAFLVEVAFLYAVTLRLALVESETSKQWDRWALYCWKMQQKR